MPNDLTEARYKLLDDLKLLVDELNDLIPINREEVSAPPLPRRPPVSGSLR